MASTSTPDLGQSTLMANAIRALAMDAVQQANSGHPGAPMGMADMAVAPATRTGRTATASCSRTATRR
jgi:transketolase